MNIGIHFSNRYWEAPDEKAYSDLALTKPDCIKTCLFSTPRFDVVGEHRRLRQEHPNALIVARLFADMGGGPWPAGDFVQQFKSQIDAVRPYVTWFEVHNEPNLDAGQAGYGEGFGHTDQDFINFRAWIDAVLSALRQNHPWAKWVFPGNAIHRYHEFWVALQDSIRKFDAWGVHAYWQAGHHNDPTFGRCYERAHALLPNMPIIITESGDSTNGMAPNDKIPVYTEWLKTVDKAPYVMGTALYIMGGTADWITHPSRPNFDITTQMAQAIGQIPREEAWPIVTDGFDFPVGKPDGQGYYVFAGLVEDNYRAATGYWHTGEDWNDIQGGDSDLGAPVYATANGRVVTSWFYSGWGNVVLIEHALPDGRMVWSQYAHLLERMVSKDEIVRRGQKIGTIGKGAAGQYWAHLHFEIRKRRLPASKWGFVTDKDRQDVIEWYAHPTDFISRHRPGMLEVAVTVDDEGEGFSRSLSSYWYEDDAGYKGHTYWTWTVGDELGEDCIATWRPKLEKAGLYEVFAFVPRRSATTQNAMYDIVHRRGVQVVAVSQNDYYDEWVSLGTYAFTPDQEAAVHLSDLTGEPYTRDESTRKKIAFDAMLWVLLKYEA